MSSRLMNHERALREEINVLKERLQPTDTGHIHTTISTLEERVQEINKQIEDNKLDEPIEANDGCPKRRGTCRSEENIRWVHNFFEVVVIYLDCTYFSHVCK